ncbi:RNA-binding protein [Schizosaccharomyces japonicus yFS275]|uniref:RNA-binding protein n=1 Tax=Schizosaccharomyces japonicus (strain yFS275 / FY16936) TaxID=402676 RepID=B6K7V3_SCHJY|nr:RNA-binding protein [Schizosaccharomyces japonicus yFS275]EEB09607.2 RNA-binding protein [Schizosaccharomyces japonicus yFS275]
MSHIQPSSVLPVTSMAYNQFSIPKAVDEKENSLFDVTFQDEPDESNAAPLNRPPPGPAVPNPVSMGGVLQLGPAVGMPSHQNQLPMRGLMDDAAYATQQLTLRALLSTREAGIIIGKSGKNVAELRSTTNVKAGITKAVPNVHDRVLTISGSLENVVRAYRFIIDIFAKNSTNANGTPVDPHAPRKLRLLIAHSLMGSIIGRNGLRIKLIQDKCSCRMIASKDMLPQSTERTVEVHGTVENLHAAIWEIGKCLIDDWERGAGTVFYNPVSRLTQPFPTVATSPRAVSQQMTPAIPSPMMDGGAAPYFFPPAAPQQPRITQNISIPADMVGCIIGRAGSKISEIRRSSGSKISIAKEPHDETGERMFTITGTHEENERALYLLYQQLELEKDRRSH